MPRSAFAEQEMLPEIAQRVIALAISATRFVASDRGEDCIRRWIPRNLRNELPPQQFLVMMARTVTLAADLLLSHASSNGTTAIDRLARKLAASRPHAPLDAREDARAIAALQAARFRLLRLEQLTPPAGAIVRDLRSGESLRFASHGFPQIGTGATFFARVAVLDGASCCLPGLVTVLDDAGSAIASSHAAAGALAPLANHRWADAVYSRAVRDGTAEIFAPGDDDDDPAETTQAEGGPLFAVIGEWVALGDAQPDERLLQRTRPLADLNTILDALTGCVLERDRGDGKVARAMERVISVLLETVLRRERSNSGTLTLDLIGREVDDAIARHGTPHRVRSLFDRLRREIDGGTARSDADPAGLARLMQRIQALRAKTVARGCTEHEALAAAEKVSELLDRYGLSLSELEFRAQPCDGIGIQTNRHRMAPIDSCMPGIAAFFDCRVWVERATGAALRYVFFGLRADVAAAQYLYELVELAFETETKAFRAGELYHRMAGERRSASNSFQIGLARGICSKLVALRSARDAVRRSASGRDLVPLKAALVDDEIEKLGLDLKSRAIGSSARVLSDPFAAGQEAGARFEYTPGVAQGG